MIQSFISWAWWCNQFLAQAHYTTVHPYTARQIRCVQYNGVQCTVRPVLCGLCCHQCPVSSVPLLVTELRTPNLVQGRSPAAVSSPGSGSVRRGRALASDTLGTPGQSRVRKLEYQSAILYSFWLLDSASNSFLPLLINNLAWQCGVPLTHVWQCWVFAWLHICLISALARCGCQGGRSLPRLAALDPGWDWASEAEWRQSCSDTQQSAVIKWIMTQWTAKRSYPVWRSDGDMLWWLSWCL